MTSAANNGMCGELHPNTSPLPRLRTTLKAASVRHPQKQFPSLQMAFNEKTDFTTISISDNTIEMLLKQLRTQVK